MYASHICVLPGSNIAKTGKTSDMIEEEEKQRLRRKQTDTASVMKTLALNSSYYQDVAKDRPSSIPREFISFRNKADENQFSRQPT